MDRAQTAGMGGSKGRCRCLSSGTPLVQVFLASRAGSDFLAERSATMRRHVLVEPLAQHRLEQLDHLTSSARLCGMSLASGRARRRCRRRRRAALPLATAARAGCGLGWHGAAAASAAAASSEHSARRMRAHRALAGAPRRARAARRPRRPAGRLLVEAAGSTGAAGRLCRLGARAEERRQRGAQHLGPRQFRLGQRAAAAGQRQAGASGAAAPAASRGPARHRPAGQEPQRVLSPRRRSAAVSRGASPGCVWGGAASRGGVALTGVHRADRTDRRWAAQRQPRRWYRPDAASAPACVASPCLSCSTGVAATLVQRLCRLLRQALADRREDLLQAPARQDLAYSYHTPLCRQQSRTLEAARPEVRQRIIALLRTAPISDGTTLLPHGIRARFRLEPGAVARPRAISWAGISGVAARAGAAPRGGRRHA